MADRGHEGNRGRRRPAAHKRGWPARRPGSGGMANGSGTSAGAPSGGSVSAPRQKRGLGLRRLAGNEYELVHPRGVRAMELDFQEGLELRKAGDPEAARDALRYALRGCGDNLWVHVALGQIALEDFKDPALARGHFGYAFELAERALPRGFTGRLPSHSQANRPLYDAMAGLAYCYEALGRPADAAELRARASRWSSSAPRPDRPAQHERREGSERPGGPAHPGTETQPNS